MNSLKKTTLLISFLAFYLSYLLSVNAKADEKLNIYKIDPSLLNDYNVLEKGTVLDLVLLNDVKTNTKYTNGEISFYIPNNDSLNINATGNITRSAPGERLSMLSSLELSTNKLILDNGQEINFSATSPLFTEKHPPHTYSHSAALAQTITNLSLSFSPATFGTSLGISFLINGFLSAKNNGISDFVWGGLDGTGLSFIENLLRKQPDVSLANGTLIPFTLREDLKISNGIQKEKVEPLNLNTNEAINRIQNLIKWGDLTGALELSLKTNQTEISNELKKKFEL